MSRTSPPYSPSPFHKMPKFLLLSYHSLTVFSSPHSLAPYATLKLERGRAHHSRGPQQFSCWPASGACVVVLASRKPRKGLTVVPLRGGDRREDPPFERIIPGGCSDSAYRRPPGYRGCGSKRGDARCAQGNKHCSYVFVDSNQIMGGRNTHGKHPQAPAAATNLNHPILQPKVYLPLVGHALACHPSAARTPFPPRSRRFALPHLKPAEHQPQVPWVAGRTDDPPHFHRHPHLR